MKTPVPAFTLLLAMVPMTLITFHTLTAGAAGTTTRAPPPAPSPMSEHVRAARDTVVGGLESGAFAFVVNAGGERLVVIHNALDKGVRKGAPRALGGKTRTLLYPLDERRLTPRERAWQGRALRLFDHRGAVCDARVTSLAVWTRTDDQISAVDASGQPEKPQEQDALVLRIAATSGTCQGARFARDASLVTPAIYTASDQVSPAVRTKTIMALRKLRAYRTIQRRYLAEVTQHRAATWHEHEGTTVELRTYVAAGGKTALVGVAVNAGAGCGEFGAMMSALFEVTQSGGLVLRSGDVEGSTFPHEPSALLDFGDGRGLALLADAALIRHAQKDVFVEKRVGTDFYMGCGC